MKMDAKYKALKEMLSEEERLRRGAQTAIVAAFTTQIPGEPETRKLGVKLRISLQRYAVNGFDARDASVFGGYKSEKAFKDAYDQEPSAAIYLSFLISQHLDAKDLTDDTVYSSLSKTIHGALQDRNWAAATAAAKLLATIRGMMPASGGSLGKPLSPTLPKSEFDGIESGPPVLELSG